jgi:site-specific DNA-methyltransferase (adenine-specific)
MQGDCLERMKEIADGSVDMVLADPPYGTTACKWDSIIPIEPMWEQLKRVIKPNGAIVMTASQPFTTTLIYSNIKMFKYCWVWEKSRASNPMLSKKQPMKFHEDICVFYGKQPIYNPQMTKGVKNHASKNVKATVNIHGGRFSEFAANTSDMKYPRSVCFVKSTDSTRNLHPTQKPVALMEYLIRTYTNKNETVLDFTMGSGTTGVACANLDRKFIGIELDQGYFDIAKERICL